MGYMFEAEIESILNVARTRTIGEDDGITLRRVLASDIHPAIKAYVRAEVETLLEQERAREQRSPRFPYSHPEVVSLQQQIDRILILHYHFDRQDFDTLLDQSVHFEFNYLCRPQWTLLNLVMGNQRRVSAMELERKLRPCVDYRYFPDLLKRYISDRGIVDITYEEFKSLLERIDQEVTARLGSADLARMMQALIDFLGSGPVRGESGGALLPTNAAIVFFEDKQMTDLRARLERDRDLERVEALSIARLAEVIEEVRTGEVAVPGPEPEAAATADDADGPVMPATSITAPEAETPEPETIPSDASESGGEPSVLTPAHGLPEVQTCFTEAERKKFLKSVFKKDDHAFAMTLDELNHIESWQETSLFLDSLFVSLDIDPFSEPAVHFTDRLYTRFFPDQAQGS